MLFEGNKLLRLKEEENKLNRKKEKVNSDFANKVKRMTTLKNDRIEIVDKKLEKNVKLQALEVELAVGYKKEVKKATTK